MPATWQVASAASSSAAALCLALLPCCALPDEAAGKARTGDVVAWEYDAPPARTTLALFPQDRDTPTRLKQHLWTNNENDVLTARVTGRDPMFLWKLDVERPIASLRIDLSANRDGYLQLFWVTRACPIFSEPCSQRQPIRAGRQPVDFALSVSSPIRELRLDLAEDIGLEIEFFEIALTDAVSLRTPWAPGNPETRATIGEGALAVDSTGTDPWISITTPPATADPGDVLEVALSFPLEADPQLFWTTDDCPYFQERCSAVLPSVDGGAGTVAVSMRGREGWRGRVSALRLDPGAAPGHYELGFVRWSRNGH